jgi:hypothetical protein
MSDFLFYLIVGLLTLGIGGGLCVHAGRNMANPITSIERIEEAIKADIRATYTEHLKTIDSQVVELEGGERVYLQRRSEEYWTTWEHLQSAIGREYGYKSFVGPVPVVSIKEPDQ